MIDLLAVLIILEVCEYVIAYQRVNHVLKHPVELAGKQSLLAVFS